MSLLAQLHEQNKKLWSGLLFWQKATIISVVAAAFMGITVLLVMSGQTKMEPLYTNLDPRDASAIVAKLKEQNAKYQLVDEGRTILVAADEKYQLRLDMAGEINLQGVVGFESFNETRFGETDTDKRVRFLVALQGELTRTIEELDEVEKAKVHIALPQPSLFIQEQKETTASVLLRLKPYASLKPEQIKSVMSFVSHSVEGLKAENVTIMDVNGNLLSEGLGEGPAVQGKISVAQLALKQQYEKDLSRSIQTMLEQMRGPGKAVVRASVLMDFDQVETLSEIYGDSVLASEQIKEETSSGTNIPQGGNPADANMGGPSYGEIGAGGNTEYELTERTRNYEVSRTVETKISAPGRINRISVSVLIDGELTEDEETKISEAVGRAAGIDSTRGDQVAIVAMPFNTEAAQKLEEQLAQAERAEARREYIRIGLYALGVLLSLGLLVYLFRGMKGFLKNVVLSPRMETAASTSGSVDFTIPLNPETTEKQQMYKQVEQLALNKPEDVAKVLKTWMAEE